ncbi:ClpP/crotonase-like domain-containing protein [Phakopsora pachyrhizi]|nr:ClpP/crotonase-like domain-containing protein [Phakopsora pachyrhizi]
MTKTQNRISSISNHLKIIQQGKTISFDSHQRLGYRSTGSNPDPDDVLVLVKTESNLRSLTLNRPKSLNALNREMIELLTSNLLKWESSEGARLIIIKGIGRAFCSGGDVVSVISGIESEEEKQRQSQSIDFFRTEYRLDSFIAKMSTPVICFLDGITSLSMHTPFRIATENTRVAMPETAIGLFPDVGATFFLPRLDGQIGTYLGLTGTSLFGWSAYQAGFATHFVLSEQLPHLEQRLQSLSSSPNLSYQTINSTINEFSPDPSILLDPSNDKLKYELVNRKREAIDYCFGEDEVEKILIRLKKIESGEIFDEFEFQDDGKIDGKNGKGRVEDDLKGWARDVIETLMARSPTSLKVTLMALREGKKFNIDECFLMEMKLAATFCDLKVHSDFLVGVKHLLVEKNKSRPNWKPNTLSQVNLKTLSNTFFSKPSKQQDGSSLSFIDTRVKPYKSYPYPIEIKLPSEDLIRSLVIGDLRGFSGNFGITESDLIKFFKNPNNYTRGDGGNGGICWFDKVGVRQKIDEVLRRKTNIKRVKTDPNHHQQGEEVLEWQH